MKNGYDIHILRHVKGNLDTGLLWNLKLLIHSLLYQPTNFTLAVNLELGSFLVVGFGEVSKINFNKNSVVPFSSIALLRSTSK